jgi:hypothetical protein
MQVPIFSGTPLTNLAAYDFSVFPLLKYPLKKEVALRAFTKLFSEMFPGMLGTHAVLHRCPRELP